MSISPIVAHQERQLELEDCCAAEVTAAMNQAARAGDTEQWQRGLTDLVALQRAQIGGVDEGRLRQIVADAGRALLAAYMDALGVGEAGLAAQFRSRSAVDAMLAGPPSETRFEQRPVVVATMIAAAVSSTTLSSSQLVTALDLEGIELCIVLLLHLFATDPIFARACRFASGEHSRRSLDEDLVCGLLFGAPGPLWA